jgi:hypothetical protein
MSTPHPLSPNHKHVIFLLAYTNEICRSVPDFETSDGGLLPSVSIPLDSRSTENSFLCCDVVPDFKLISSQMLATDGSEEG